MKLQDALKWWKTNRVEPFDLSHDGQHAMTLIVEAARRVANLDIEAARESVDMPAVVLLLWRIMELMGVGVAEFPERDTTGFAMMIRDSIINRELFDVALGVTEDE